MSRYIKKLPNGNEVAYGYADILGYFIQEFDKEPDEDGEDVLLLNECSTLTKMKNTKMADFMVQYDLPPHQIEMVLMDLPI